MILGIDLGGTKTLFGLFSESGKLIESNKIPTPADYPTFIDELSAEINQFASVHHITSYAMALPARLDRKSGIAFAFGNLSWTNIPIVQDIKDKTGISVHIENDAKLAALSEAQLVLNKYRKALYITISTGIGVGLVIDGKLDPNNLDMEGGQMLLEHEGRLRDWEDFGSGHAFQEKFGKRVGDIGPDDHEEGYWLARNIAIGLIDLTAVLTPEVIIMGGGAGAHLDKFKDRLDEQLKIYENPMFKIPPIVPAQRPEEAVIYGCYELARQKQ